METTPKTEAELKAEIKRLVMINNLLKGDKFSYTDYTERESFNPNDKPITYTLHTKGKHYRYKATFLEFYNLLANNIKEQVSTL